MNLRAAMATLATLPCVAFAQDTVGLSQGQVITKSVRVVPNERLTLPPGAPGVCLTIKGSDITVDFSDAYVRGEKDVYHNRENFNGVGLLIQGCRNVTVRNAHIQGFRFNIQVVDSQNVRLENCDVSFSRAILMMQNGSTLDTFLNLRDSNAWRNYGSGIWIERSSGCTVERCYGTGGLIGTAIVDSTGVTVTSSDFSFNGGWGVALSHASDSTVAWNRLDFVNRTWGGGWGADSAALAVANDCDHNFFVGNSMTHSGDGFFLSNLNDIGPVDPKTRAFAPKGGSDGNVIAYSDGSWSPANAFEGTFSDANVYFRNQANASGYGFWLGFSTHSLLIENTINDSRANAIAIEQGRGTRIEGNHIERVGSSAIHLWQSDQKERKPFPSTEIDILQNTVADTRMAFELDGSTDIMIRDNKLVRAPAGSSSSSTRAATSPLVAFQGTSDWQALQKILASRPADFKMYAQDNGPKGLQWVQPDDYGPQDFRGDLAAHRQANPGMLELYLMEVGVKVSAPTWTGYEDTPEDPRLVRITAKPTEQEIGEDKPVEITLVSKDGQRKQKISAVLRTAVWDLKWYSWRGVHYDDDPAWVRIWAGKPLKTERVRELGGDWTGRSPSEGVPASFFALAATTTIKVPAGRYLFHTISDDGIKVFVDDRPVIVRWNHHGPTPDNTPVALDANPHTIRVEYCQEDGAAVLRLDWTRQ